MRPLGVFGLLLILLACVGTVFFPAQGQAPYLITPPPLPSTIFPFWTFFVGTGAELNAGQSQWSDFNGQNQSTHAPVAGVGYTQWLAVTTFDQLTVSIQTAQPVSGTLVCSLYKGLGAGADTLLSVTFPAGSTGGTVVQDLTHSFTSAPGDQLSIHCANNAASLSASAGILSIRTH